MALVENEATCAQAVFHAARATECALKAYIWRTERFNQWPSRRDRDELYTHDLRRLRSVAGIMVDPTEATAPSWHVMLQWDRNQGYDPKPMPSKVAQGFVEAAFGPDGVVTWLRQILIPRS